MLKVRLSDESDLQVLGIQMATVFSIYQVKYAEILLKVSMNFSTIFVSKCDS